MQVSHQISGNVFTAWIADRLTFSDYTGFRTLLNQINNAKVTKCIFDLSKLDKIDAAGLGLLTLALNEGKKHGWAVVIQSPKGQVQNLIELGKFQTGANHLRERTAMHAK